MFESFKTQRVTTSATEIHVTWGGNGPPLLLLHGYPQTHLMWHKVAPALAKDFTVVVPDLPGHEASRGELNCSQQLVAGNGNWRLEPFDPVQPGSKQSKQRS